MKIEVINMEIPECVKSLSLGTHFRLVICNDISL